MRANRRAAGDLGTTVNAYDDAEVAIFAANEQTDIDIDVGRYVRLARLVLDAERVMPEVEMSLLFVDEQTITELNERYLGYEGPTDVLSWSMDDDLTASGRDPDHGGRGPGSPSEPSDPPTVLGDVVVCPAVAGRQAGERGVAIDDELALLVVHGVLHLLNYDHAEPAEEAAMQRREREILAEFAEGEEQP
jgi:probable rRNA maturation factor